jgi:TonB family protein
MSVETKNHKLLLRGNRVALVADNQGRLVRRTISSTTNIFPSGKKFIANLEIRITIESDANGSFESALKAIFANGLEDLASSVPPWWECYAKAYFVDMPKPEQNTVLEACFKEKDAPVLPQAGSEKSGIASPPVLLSSQDLNANIFVRSLGLQGTSTIRLVVTETGDPADLQIVRPLGAGLDEDALHALSQYHFKPSERDGKPVAAVLNIDCNVNSE